MFGLPINIVVAQQKPSANWSFCSSWNCTGGDSIGAQFQSPQLPPVHIDASGAIILKNPI